MPRGPRVTADDYEIFVTSLCLAFRPGPERDNCVWELTARLIAIYAEYQTPPPPGLGEFAERIGVDVSTYFPRRGLAE
jgi:hypothetical protein